MPDVAPIPDAPSARKRVGRWVLNNVVLSAVILTAVSTAVALLVTRLIPPDTGTLKAQLKTLAQQVAFQSATGSETRFTNALSSFGAYVDRQHSRPGIEIYRQFISKRQVADAFLASHQWGKAERAYETMFRQLNDFCLVARAALCPVSLPARVPAPKHVPPTSAAGLSSGSGDVSVVTVVIHEPPSPSLGNAGKATSTTSKSDQTPRKTVTVIRTVTVPLSSPHSQSATTPATVPVGATYLERESISHPVNTFTTFYGTGLGPPVASGQEVEVACKVYAPTIAAVIPDGYWYRISSPPWSGRYYVPAKTFYNGDPIGGPYTHNTDFAVPNC